MKKGTTRTSAQAHGALMTRTDFVHKAARSTFEERLASSGAIDLRGNHKTVVHSSGFVGVVPVDASRRWRNR
jgi:hypothetical protein